MGSGHQDGSSRHCFPRKAVTQAEKILLDYSLFIRLSFVAVEETGRTGGLGPIAVQALTVPRHPFLKHRSFPGRLFLPVVHESQVRWGPCGAGSIKYFLLTTMVLPSGLTLHSSRFILDSDLNLSESRRVTRDSPLMGFPLVCCWYFAMPPFMSVINRQCNSVSFIRQPVKR
jgi:hypothetical protein